MGGTIEKKRRPDDHHAHQDVVVNAERQTNQKKIQKRTKTEARRGEIQGPMTDTVISDIEIGTDTGIVIDIGIDVVVVIIGIDVIIGIGEDHGHVREIAIIAAMVIDEICRFKRPHVICRFFCYPRNPEKSHHMKKFFCPFLQTPLYTYKRPHRHTTKTKHTKISKKNLIWNFDYKIQF